MRRQEQNFGLVQQAIHRAPRWLIRKLTRTYLTLGLRDIAKEVGIETEEEVRTIIVNMVRCWMCTPSLRVGFLTKLRAVCVQVECDEINAHISTDGTVTFVDATPQISKADIDQALAQAQEQSKLLIELERAMNISKEYLTKVGLCICH